MPRTCSTRSAPEASPSLSPPPATGVSSAPNIQWSAEQMDALFAIARQKPEQELQAVTAKARHDEEESLARIATIRAPSNVAAPADSTMTGGEDEEALLGKISPITLSVSGRCSGLPKVIDKKSHFYLITLLRISFFCLILSHITIFHLTIFYVTSHLTFYQLPVFSFIPAYSALL